MSEDYRKYLKDELKNIHDKKFELYERIEELKVFNNPNVFFNYIGNPKLFLERKNLKNRVDFESSTLDSIYSSLRYQYRNSFSHFENSELVRKQEDLGNRINDLDERYNRVKSFKRDNLMFKFSSQNRRINSVLRKIKHEKSKQREFLEDTLNEIWNRGICLEMYYTQKVFRGLN